MYPLHGVLQELQQSGYFEEGEVEEEPYKEADDDHLDEMEVTTIQQKTKTGWYRIFLW